MAAIRVAVLVLSMVVIGHCLANEDEEQRTLPQIMQEKVKRFFEATGTMGERSEMEEGISKRFMDSVMGSDCGAFGCKRSETQEKIKRFMDSVMGSDCGAFGCKRSDTVEKLKRVLHSLSERSREQLPHGRVMAKKEAAERGEGNQRRFVGQLASECGLSCDKKRRDSPLPEDRSRRLLEQVKDGAQQISKRFMSLQSGGCDDPACKMAKRNAEARAKRLSEILSGSPKKVGTRGVDRVVGLDPETDNSDKRRDSEDTMTSALRNARESRWSAAEEMLARMAKKRRAEEEMAQRESDCNSDCLKRSAKNVHDLVDQEQEKKRYVESLLEELRRKRNEELIERRILENVGLLGRRNLHWP